ncbi:MAG TPA: hypothetical protein VGY57_13470 [Vicinamibacterales bacterium]|nr:hypothetical protein [Vicinamibacterales bacterium]
MLLIHALSAMLALVTGGVLLVADKRQPLHGRLGVLYHWTMLVVAVSALTMSAMRGRAVIFTYLTPPSYAAALIAYLSAVWRWRGWLRWHIAGQSASFIALITGFLIQAAPRAMPADFFAAHRTVIIWALLLTPALAAQPLIARTQARWNRRRPNAPIAAESLRAA